MRRDDIRIREAQKFKTSLKAFSRLAKFTVHRMPRGAGDITRAK